MLKENFLHFVWKLQYFNKQQLRTTSGEEVVVFHPGSHNTDAGPDFQNARVKIGEIEWYGNIEIHVKSSDWKLHHHNEDEAYDNVILHVTYTDDDPVRRADGSLVPAIELKERIADKVLLKYAGLQSSRSDIPCASQHASVPQVFKTGMIERMVSERLHQRGAAILELLKRNNGDWQETNYQCLASSFGFKLNSEPFLRLAKSMPLKILLKHRNNIEQLEALLFGQAGFLEEKLDDMYYLKLKREYQFLAAKYSLEQDRLAKHEWKFLRIRPANFPTIRLAQFASLIHAIPEVLTSYTDFTSSKEVQKKFALVETSEYWLNHYVFGEETSDVFPKHVGKESVESIIINTIVPVYFCLGKERDIEAFVEQGLKLLESMAPENNAILKKWLKIGISSASAFDSQGLIHLYNHYCKKKSCLECEIGAAILKGAEKKAVAKTAV